MQETEESEGIVKLGESCFDNVLSSSIDSFSSLFDFLFFFILHDHSSWYTKHTYQFSCFSHTAHRGKSSPSFGFISTSHTIMEQALWCKSKENFYLLKEDTDEGRRFVKYLGLLWLVGVSVQPA